MNELIITFGFMALVVLSFWFWATKTPWGKKWIKNL